MAQFVGEKKKKTLSPTNFWVEGLEGGEKVLNLGEKLPGNWVIAFI